MASGLGRWLPLIAIGVIIAGCSTLQSTGPLLTSEPEKPRFTELPALPASSRPQEPLAFQPPIPASFAYFVDARTLTVTREGEVRFMLIARSPSGAENISLEALRCTLRERRTLGYGRNDGSWASVPEQRSPWSPVPTKATNNLLTHLFEEYFCPRGIPIADAAEGVSALRRGGNPRAAPPER